MSLVIEAKRALNIKHTLGTRVAAGFLRNKGWSLAGSLNLLCGRKS